MTPKFWSPFKRLLGPTPWKLSWQRELSETLQSAQKDLNVNMIVVIARESDLYSELLFLLCFLGISLGSCLGYIFSGSVIRLTDMMLFPLAGFALGALIFHFKRHFIHKVAPKAVRDRVGYRAKAIYFDHTQHMNGSVVLLYVSEMEHEALLLADNEVLQKLPGEEMQRILSLLVKQYRYKNPLESLKPAIVELGQLLRRTLGVSSEGKISAPVFIGPTDMAPSLPPVRILKGSKDIN